MTTKKKLATAALAGLFTAGLVAASPAIAGEHDKGACKGASGCKGEAAVEKSECKGAASCKTAGETEKHACKGENADGKHACKGHDSTATEGSK